MFTYITNPKILTHCLPLARHSLFCLQQILDVVPPHTQNQTSRAFLLGAMFSQWAFLLGAVFSQWAFLVRPSCFGAHPWEETAPSVDSKVSGRKRVKPNAPGHACHEMYVSNPASQIVSILWSRERVRSQVLDHSTRTCARSYDMTLTAVGCICAHVLRSSYCTCVCVSNLCPCIT